MIETKEIAVKKDQVEVITRSALQEFKNKIDAVTKTVKNINIKDVSSFSISLKIIKNAKDISKAIEDKRKIIKDPYLTAGKLIDSIAKEFIGELDVAIKEAKDKAAGYYKIIEAKKAAALEKLAKSLEEVGSNKEAEIEVLKKEYDQVLDAYEYVLKKILDANGGDREVLEQTILSMEDNFVFKYMFESTDFFIESLFKQLEADQDPELEKAEFTKGLKEIGNNIASKISAKFSVAAIQVQAAVKTVEETKVTGSSFFTKRWKFEVMDEAAVPRELLSPDENKIKEYIKNNKDALTDGIVIGGIRYFIESSLTSK